LNGKINRRNLILGGSAVAVAAVSSNSALARENLQSSDKAKLAPPKDGDEAMERLLAGNERFISGKLNHPHTASEWRKRLVGGQNPFVTIIGFVIRVAGNVIDTDVAGSVEYGVDHLATKLVVVMGHEGCGAVTAALATMANFEKEPNEIQALVGKIKPAIRTFKEGTSFDDRLKTSVEDNVRNSVKLLKAIPDLAKAEKESRTKIVGTVYEIETGQVRVI